MQLFDHRRPVSTRKRWRADRVFDAHCFDRSVQEMETIAPLLCNCQIPLETDSYLPTLCLRQLCNRPMHCTNDGDHITDPLEQPIGESVVIELN